MLGQWSSDDLVKSPFVDAVPEVNYPTGKSIAEFKPNLWNKDKFGAWYKDLGKIEYVIA